MAGRIPKVFIDELLARIDIVDVIGARVSLRKKGRNYSTCCPFHNERTPSFSLSQEKQFYHCFGCGIHGNVIDFIIEYEHLSFLEAIEELASHLGVEVPRESGSLSGITSFPGKQPLYELMGDVAHFYNRELEKPSSQPIVDYLRGRGLSAETTRHFGIGYADNKWDSVLKRFSKQRNSQEMLLVCGLIAENERRERYDFFRNRVIFPIRDRRGRVIAFGGRVTKGGKPKYLNSPETPLFSKKKELYGLYEVLKRHRKPEQILIVEGYMDVVELAQYGIDYAVSPLGTSTTESHLRLLFQTTSTVVCCYDGDKAGQEAAWRTLENALGHLKSGIFLKFLFLPDGEDPDSYIRKYGKENVESRVKGATPMSSYLFSRLLQEIDTVHPEGKAALESKALSLIHKIPDIPLRDQLLHLLEQKTGIYRKPIARKDGVRVSQGYLEIRCTPMRAVISLLLKNPGYASRVPNLLGVESLTIPGLKLLNEVLDRCRTHPGFTTGQLLEHWRNDHKRSLLSRLAYWHIPIVNNNEEDIFWDSLDKVLSQCVEKRIEILQVKERSTGLSEDEKKDLLKLMLDLKT